MASSRGVAHLSRELVNKLVGIVTDPRMPVQRKLDQASATLDRVIRDAESPAAGVRHTVVSALDDAISTATELARGGTARHDIEARVRVKLVDALKDVPGISVEGGR
ncbi:hypothetical protein [Gryllotalpicola protaetiae]|uniref:Uncharacterized protein n=1 Tax=Gryllotalpicola protaetiae TaxID=2419771 RepID=A0A387BNE9_9MICO|nr:hypothetical protein [Gryllotalpicola protaetiae]AYG02517.1 hypothetical protein D7I44_02575 [Gryllotalpicola protaetiae]